MSADLVTVSLTLPRFAFIDHYSKQVGVWSMWGFMKTNDQFCCPNAVPAMLLPPFEILFYEDMNKLLVLS